MAMAYTHLATVFAVVVTVPSVVTAVQFALLPAML